MKFFTVKTENMINPKFKAGEMIRFKSHDGTFKVKQIEKVSIEIIYYPDKKQRKEYLNYFLFGVYKAYKEEQLQKND